jgi:nicotinamidase-related amidase
LQVIHSPSNTLDFYAGAPQRQRVADASVADTPEPIDLLDPPLPIDDSDGGCDTGECAQGRPWTRQHPAIEIAESDAISDDGQEVYSVLHDRGIKTLLFTGVHTNMCVLNRSFGIKQMTRWGVECVLVRDLTDTMYNPKRAPYVSHDEGTELVIEHIEQHWCPTVTSTELMPLLKG